MTQAMRAAVCISVAAILTGCAEPAPGAQGQDDAVQAPVKSALASNPLSGPLCDDVEVVETVQDAFDTHQASETKTDFTLDDVSGAREIGAVAHPGGDWSQTRACAANAALSNGETIEIWYQIKSPRADDGIGYRVKPCFAKFDELHPAGCHAFAVPPSP